MGHDPRVGQASDQASEVFRVGAGPLPQRTDPHEGTPAGASQITSHVTEADRHRSLQPASGQPRRSSQPNQASILSPSARRGSLNGWEGSVGRLLS